MHEATTQCLCEMPDDGPVNSDGLPWPHRWLSNGHGCLRDAAVVDVMLVMIVVVVLKLVIAL